MGGTVMFSVEKRRALCLVLWDPGESGNLEYLPSAHQAPGSGEARWDGVPWVTAQLLSVQHRKWRPSSIPLPFPLCLSPLSLPGVQMCYYVACSGSLPPHNTVFCVLYEGRTICPAPSSCQSVCMCQARESRLHALPAALPAFFPPFLTLASAPGYPRVGIFLQRHPSFFLKSYIVSHSARIYFASSYVQFGFK